MDINGIKMCINCMHSLNSENECVHCGYIQSEYKQIPCNLSPGTVLSDRYVIGKVLGEGSFGITYIGWDTLLECIVAIKEYFPLEFVTRDVINGNNNVYLFSEDNQSEYSERLEKFLKEARCLTKFNMLSGVVSVRDFFYENETAYIVMEYVNGCSVKEFIQKNGKMNGKEVISLMKPVLKALEEIHKAGIVHRDISPDNLLFSEKGELVLIDFGASCLRDIDMMRSMTITFKRGFSPEEQYRSKGVLGAWTDVYSVCATIYYMLTGIIPIESVERIVGGKLESLVDMNDIDVTMRQKSALMKGLSIEAKDRYQAVSQLYADMYFAERTSELKDNIQKKKRKTYIRMVTIVMSLLILTGAFSILKSYFQKPVTKPEIISVAEPVMSELTEMSEVSEPVLTVTPDPVVYKMISVVGMSEEKAKKKLKKIGSPDLDIIIKRIYDSKTEKGKVVKQSKKQGITWGENEKITITLYVSKGEKTVISQNNMYEDDVIGVIE